MLGSTSRREALVGEALRRDQEDVDGVGRESVVDVVPFGLVAGIDGRRPDAEPLRHRDLVAHQREERADDQGRAVTLVAADASRDPVDEALAPAGPLDDERAFAVPRDGLDGLALAVAEGGERTEHGLEVAPEGVVGIDVSNLRICRRPITRIAG